MRELLDALVDDGSFLEVHKRWAKELIVGYARLDGRVVGIVANQPKFKGGVLFVDSADKAARFIWTCNAFGIPLLFLADVPGFMIGTAVERQGIIRHGAKMISAVSEATVPKLSVIVRKAYGAGLYAMAGPAFEPDACIALPSAKIAVMGPSAAVNAVFYNQLAAIEDEAERAAKRAELMAEYAEGVDLLHLASELVIDAVVQPEDLREELVRRFARYAGRHAPAAAQAQRDPAGLGRPARAAQPVDLVLLAHDQVLHQVLERLRARLLAGVRDDGVQRRDRLVLGLDQRVDRGAGVAASSAARRPRPSGSPPSAVIFSTSSFVSSSSARANSHSLRADRLVLQPEHAARAHRELQHGALLQHERRVEALEHLSTSIGSGFLLTHAARRTP